VTGAGCQMPGATPLRRALGGRCGMFSNRSNRDLNFETEATTAASHRNRIESNEARAQSHIACQGLN